MLHQRTATAVLVLGISALGACSTTDTKATVDAQPKMQSTNAMRVLATVEAIDKENRILTVRDQNGDLRTMVVNSEVKGFKEIKRGDRIVAEYLDEVAVYIEAPGTTMKDDSASVVAKTSSGGKPSGALVEAVQRRATVESIDYRSRVVTLRGQDGAMRTITVSPRLGSLEKINRGDNIIVRSTQTVAVGITKAP